MDAVIVSTALALATAAFNGPAITVNYPAEKASFGPLSATYILGSVQPPERARFSEGGAVETPHRYSTRGRSNASPATRPLPAT